jgi:hypothetical protein
MLYRGDDESDARTLSIKRLYEISDEDAFLLFKEMRWGSNGNVVYPHCGTAKSHYFIQTRYQ